MIQSTVTITVEVGLLKSLILAAYDYNPETPCKIEFQTESVGGGRYIDDFPVITPKSVSITITKEEKT